jgi:DNA-binding CsgD family transcriptional regulator
MNTFLPLQEFSPRLPLQEFSPRADSNHSVDGPPALPSLGFVVADGSLRPLSANHEAIAILLYPGALEPPHSFTEAFEKKIRSGLLRAQSLSSSQNTTNPVIQFKSGRREYLCRAFLLDHGSNKGISDAAAVLVVMERRVPGCLAMCQLTQQFHLTHREEEVLTLLLQGLSSKEMAGRMRISLNTVKAFIRLVMIKMGASSRSEIAATFLGMVLAKSDRVLSTNGAEIPRHHSKRP